MDHADPRLIALDWGTSSLRAYLLGPIGGAVVAVGIAQVLRGAGGGRTGRFSAQGTLGASWHPGPIEPGPTSGRPPKE